MRATELHCYYYYYYYYYYYLVLIPALISKGYGSSNYFFVCYLYHGVSLSNIRFPG